MIFLEKPRHLTSRQAVAKLLKDLGIPKKTKWGFVGILDPNASGLLPICMGWETKLIPFLEQVFSIKTYLACIALGQEREGDDLTGQVLPSKDLEPFSKTLFNAHLKDLPGFERTFVEMDQQVPPCYSAKKINGTRAYELAREGKPVTLPSRPIVIYLAKHLRSRLCENTQQIYTWWTFRVSKGTYIRGLARDLGKSLGIGGYLRYLKRQAMGPISLDQLPLQLTDTGMRYAALSMKDLFDEVRPSALDAHARAVMTGQKDWIQLYPTHILQEGAKITGPYVFGRITWQGKPHVLIFRAQGTVRGDAQDFRYKVLKRIDVSSNV